MTVFNNPNGVANTNHLATLMHPRRQSMVITEVREESNTMKTYTLKADDGHELAYFNAGDYIPVFVDIDGNIVERPYALCSSPEDSVKGFYQISVKTMDNGYVSNYIYNNWEVGTKVTLGGPCLGESYSSIRDAHDLIVLAGGVGVTPFRSMIKAIIEGDVDCKLTLFYGVNTLEEVVYKNEWKELEVAANGKVKVVIVVANEQVEGYEHGFITMDIINKYCNVNESSIFVSGPDGLVNHVRSMLAPLNLKKRYVRYAMNGDSTFNNSNRTDETVTIKVHYAGEEYEVQGNKKETILVSLEKAALKPAVHCRTGICGFCRSYVVSGEFSLATDITGVRARDKQLGFIHPCCSYPESDMEIVVQRA